MYLKFIILAFLVSFLAGYIVLSLRKEKDKEFLEVKDVLLTPDELISHGRELGRLHYIDKKKNVKKLLLYRLDKNFAVIEDIYLKFNKDINNGMSLPRAAEWILDNFYIIELQYKRARRSIESEKELVLNTLKSGPLKGYPRIYAIVLDLVAHSEGVVTEGNLISFIDSYQKEKVLTIREVSSLSLMLNIALLEYIKSIVILIEEIQKNWREAEKINLSILLETDTIVNNIFKADTSYIEHLLRRIKSEREDYNNIISFIDKKLNYLGTDINSVLEKEYKKQGSIKISIGNGITSLKSISNLNWEDIFEQLCLVERILKKDPANIYDKMDSQSRNYYRYQVEKLTKVLKTEEAYISSKALEFAKIKAAEGKNDKSSHIGYYIVDKGRDKIFENLGYNNSKNGIYYKHIDIYTIPIIFLTLFTAFLFCRYVFLKSNFWLSLLVGVVILIPISNISIILVNFIYSKLINPVLLPKLELKEEIPEELSTIVVMPTLLFNEERVEELCEKLEIYYLANKEENLYFSIIGDFKDGPDEVSKEDRKIIEKGLECIEKLNRKYSKGHNIFYFFHRKRVYSGNEKRWMGWERKRGALIEFNSLILGDDNTTFNVISSDISLLREKIKYVITLDGDTQLPLDTAKKLIGTISHPLNRPIFDEDKNIVIEGYGLIQPRIIIDIESGNKSLFTRIYAGQGGIDPYTTAVSDIYQDLFGEGIFVGKGIYQLDVFQKCLKDSIPENTILSHDLLEGSFVRVGLATDIELVDGYPEKYNSYIMRQHRWVRGDWQLIKWLGRKKTILSKLSKWKIFDNLRRSLISISLTLLIILGLIFFPGNVMYWMSLALSTIFFPFLLSVIDVIFFNGMKFDRWKLNGNIITGPTGYLYQGILYFMFLPYEGYIMADAILRTLYRVFISKKNLLQWTTAFEIEKNLGNSLINYFRRMSKNIVVAFLTIILTYFIHYENIILAGLIGTLWIVAPYFAYLISKEEIEYVKLDFQNIRTLRRIGRKTWDYYEKYTDEKNNFLPPDNYQEYPYNGLAYRTSPTNIGFYLMAVLSARDFGYITTTQMINLINRTLQTIRKMEKWNGHLYNWYNTTTLKPLRPYFVSTVDSGNFVSYLITLKEGIEEYLYKPLIDKVFLEGIKDTIELIENREIQMVLVDEGLDSIEDLSMCKINNLIVKANRAKKDKKDKWIEETIIQLYNLKEVYEKYFPNDEINKKSCGDIKYSFSAIELEIYYDEVLSFLEDNELELEINKLNINVKNLISDMKMAIVEIEELIKETKFAPLYDFKKDLFSVGYNVQDKVLLNSYYDLLASEARITSYIAISRREVPKEHWFKLGRPLIIKKGYRSLASWSGTMFEYLMPSLVMKNFKNTLLDESYKTVIKLQRSYCKRNKIPWGISESGFFAFDSNLNYQYKAFGVPYLGFKRGLKEDLVVSPYATFLVLPFEQEKVLENIHSLIYEGLEGEYGFYEAIDYTKKRLPIDMGKAVVKSYMTHHQGMIITAINNVLNNNIMIQRFHNYSQMKCGELLLQEKVPINIIVAKEKENLQDTNQEEFKDEGVVVRSFNKNSLNTLKCHILSSGDYSTMLTNRGEGYSKKNDIFINRWRKDIFSREYGMFIYIKNLKNNTYWSTTYKPTNKIPDDYRVKFSSDKATFYRTDGLIETKMEVVLLSEEDGEIRKVTITNNSSEEALIDVTSYFEVVGDRYESDLAHPVFNNLFVRTMKLEDYEAVLAHRRTKEGEQKKVWITHSVKDFQENTTGFQCETNRVNFVGRCRDLSNPIGLEKGLSNTTGVVLDPILSLNKRLRIKGGGSSEIYFVTSINESKKDAYKIIQRYQDKLSFSRAFNLAYTRSQTEISYLNFKPTQIKMFDNMLSSLLFLNTANKTKYKSILKDSMKGQEGLWAYGISGDNPIVLVTIKTMEGIDVLKEMLKAHEYWFFKGLRVDLIVLNGDESSYYQPLLERINEVIYEYRGNVVETPGGIYICSKNNMAYEDVALFYKWANLIIDCEEGFEKEEKVKENIPNKKFTSGSKNYPTTELELELEKFNGYGGYSQDGKEYIIKLTEEVNTPLPWINVIGNKKFGFIVSEQGTGFSWSYNSRENKLTPWFNDPISDISEEIIYIRDDDTGEVWAITPWPVRNEEAYVISHGFGYTHFYHNSKGFEQKLTMFVPKDDNIKINLLKFKNISGFERKLTIFYYVRPVLGVTDEETEMFIETSMSDEETMLAKNSTNTQFKDSTIFVGTSEKIKSYTGDRIEFLGFSSTFKHPEGTKKERLSNRVGLGLNPCCAIEVPMILQNGEEKEIVFLLGESRDEVEGKNLIIKYRDLEFSKRTLKKIKEFWEDILGKIKIETPDKSMNLLMNYWLMYQTIISRLWSRTGFYQVGGAFGARDQMQDSINSIYFLPEETKNQILNNCKHQFVEGDVQHWWHPIPDAKVHKGIRSKCSDDLLWLPYGVSKYIEVTGDYNILYENVPFIESNILEDEEYERYETPTLSKETGTIYEHCIRAIEKSLKFGKRGLPLIGTGDWNDGMSRVGYKGEGESIWLGWFLGTVLQKFILICEKTGDIERKERYEEIINKLKNAIEKNGWDGEWYLRAYFDDDTPLGSKKSRECIIDSIAQSWAVISTLGDEERSKIAMNSVEKYLVNEEEGIIKLLSPPFDESEPDPGYIKSYVPGVRENGGQYTHAATWVINAFALLGDGNKACELFSLINPINHTRTKIECTTYKVEPYVMAADVYTTPSILGRGGWTWYTGSSGWMYRVGLENILGFKKEGNKLFINPCITKEWESYSIRYRFMETEYNIEVKNPYRINRGVNYIKLDGEILKSNYVSLVNDKKQHFIEVVLGSYKENLIP